MFTGIIEQIGKVTKQETEGTNHIFWIESPISTELKVDQSVSHNGVCLTVEAIENGQHRVTAIDETLKKSTIGILKPGDHVNLERCMKMNGRIDGHIVQGHVDATVVCTAVLEKDGSTEFEFEMDPKFAGLIIEKGSITLNGVSLTIFNTTNKKFKVAIIPYTLTHTNLNQVKVGDYVNVEFDMIGKYVNRISMLKNQL
jgi:riboflavin synthase